MRLVISPTSLPLTDALVVAQAMAQRSELGSRQRLAPHAWARAASVALLRQDRAGLEALLRIELVPAVAKATALLGGTVAIAASWPPESSRSWVAEMAIRLDGTCRASFHASRVVGVAERWEALVDRERGPLTRPERGAAARLLEKAAAYLHADPRREDARSAVSRELGDALCTLAGPAQALVEAMDAGKLDELRIGALPQQLHQAYGACAAALAYELALLGRGPLVDERCLIGPE